MSKTNISDCLSSLRTITVEFHTIVNILEANPDNPQAQLAHTLAEYAMQVLVNNIVAATQPDMLSEDELDLVCHAADITDMYEDEEDDPLSADSSYEEDYE